MATTNKKSTPRKSTKTTTAKAVTNKKTVKKTVPKKTVSKNSSTKSTKQEVKLVPVKPVKTTLLSEAKKHLKKLNQWNWFVSVLFAGQAVALVILANKYYFGITSNYQTSDVLVSSTGEKVSVLATRNVFDINVVYLLTVMLVLAAIFHMFVALFSKRKYESQLERGFNKFRWLQYSFTSSLAFIVAALVVGVSDLMTLILIIASVFVFGFSSLLIELNDRQSYKSRIPGFIRFIALLTPWLVVAEYVKNTLMYGDGGIEAFVYYIIASIFVLNILSFANAKLLSSKKGKWSDYLYGEENYILLSLITLSALTWQMYVSLLS